MTCGISTQFLAQALDERPFMAGLDTSSAPHSGVAAASNVAAVGEKMVAHCHAIANST